MSSAWSLVLFWYRCVTVFQLYILVVMIKELGRSWVMVGVIVSVRVSLGLVLELG